MMKVYTSVFVLEGLRSAFGDLDATEHEVALRESSELVEARWTQAVEQGVRMEPRDGIGGTK